MLLVSFGGISPKKIVHEIWVGVILLMEEIRLTLMLVVHPIIYKVFYIPDGAGFLP